MKRRDLWDELGLPSRVEQPAPARLDTARIAARTGAHTAPAQTERKHVTMKTKRTILIALAAVLVLSLSALASSGAILGIHSHSVEEEPFTTLPTEAEALEALGCVPLLPERFANGYTFAWGYTMMNQMLGENRSVEATVPSYTFTYTLAGKQDVTFSQIPWQEGETVSFLHGDPTEIDGVTVYAARGVWGDQWGKETGEISWTVTWQQGPLQCRLHCDRGMELEELLSMARELIA
ncbi:MAG: hypothetical protein IJG08_09320 [Oscillospiraceae bacterium]|nr:hypothetical protein [Oscillospiraceae bacterium]